MAALLAAVIASVGLAVLYRLTAPARTPLAADLARLLDPLPPAATPTGAERGRLVSHLTLTVARRGWITAAVRQDLDVAAQDVDWLVARSFTAAVSIAGFVMALGLALAISGLPLGLVAVLVMGLAAGGGGLVLPTYRLREQAQGRRHELRVMLPGFLDLIGVLLAAGHSLEAALRMAAAAAEDWPHAQLHRALEAAAVTRQPAAEALQGLGSHLGVDDLAQLGDGLVMAEREGAAMRSSLAARARALREKHLADVEARAGSATEGMSFPLVAFVFGFVLLIGYPALIGLSAGLGSQ